MTAPAGKKECVRCRRRDCPGDIHFFLNTDASRAWLCQPGFVAFYARQSFMAPHPSVVGRPTIELANIRVFRSGMGTFTRLVRELSSEYPPHYLFVEAVRSARFREGLLKMGFRAAAWDGCFFAACDDLRLKEAGAAL